MINVSGRPSNSALPGSCQADRRSFQPTRMPSVNSTENNASSASVPTIGSVGPNGISPVTPSPQRKPATRKITAVDRIVRFAMFDTRTANSSTEAKTSSSVVIGSSLSDPFIRVWPGPIECGGSGHPPLSFRVCGLAAE